MKRALLLLVTLILFQTLAYGADRNSDLVSLSKKLNAIPWEVGVSVVELPSRHSLFAFQENIPRKPASVLKLATSAAALEQLGPEFRFETEGWIQVQGSPTQSFVALRGGGDPSLNLESTWLLARRVRKMGISEIGDLIADNSLFAETRERVGGRAYQTGASALSFNFNSRSFEICPTHPGSPASVLVEPFEIPSLFSGSVNTVKGLGQVSVSESSTDGKGYSISGTIGAQEDCVVLYRSVANPETYFLETIRALLGEVGVKVRGSLKVAKVPEKAVKAFDHPSEPLIEILTDLNHYSTNFIGEQVLYALGRDSANRASREEGLKAISKYLEGLGLSKESFDIRDGSGLSHENRMSAAVLTAILAAQSANPKTGIDFERTLSVGGRSGTLKRRDFSLGNDALVIRGKTGSLNGVSSLAGYLTTKKGSKVAFAILQNGIPSKDRAVDLEEEVVRAIVYH